MAYSNFNSKSVSIIGAGLVGSLLSVMLANRGFTVSVFEKRDDPNEDKETRGRSIAMSLSDRGWKALKNVDLEYDIKKITVPKHSRMVHPLKSKAQAQEYGKNGQSIYTINRRELNCILINKAKKTNKVKFYFNHKLSDINIDKKQIILNSKNNFLQKSFSYLIGADGIFSKTCQILEEYGKVKFTRNTLEYGYKELTIPTDVNGNFPLQSNHVHIWPRAKSLFLALPTLNKSYTCTLFMPYYGNNSFESICSQEILNDFLNKNFKEVVNLNPDIENEFFNNPKSKITAVEGNQWNNDDNILLIGDACHAIVPFYAMGMNVGFEDCSVFDNLMSKYNNNIGLIIEKFSEYRKPDTNAIAKLSTRNFIKIKQSVRNDFHKRWKIEREIWNQFPRKWFPLYAMIAFSHIPFRIISKINTRQLTIIDNIFKGKISFQESFKIIEKFETISN